jgi:hypothetical protein
MAAPAAYLDECTDLVKGGTTLSDSSDPLVDVV